MREKLRSTITLSFEYASDDEDFAREFGMKLLHAIDTLVLKAIEATEGIYTLSQARDILEQDARDNKDVNTLLGLIPAWTEDGEGILQVDDDEGEDN